MNVKLTKLVLQIGCPSCPSYLWIKSFPRNLNEHIKDTISGCWSTQTDMLNKAVELLGDWSFLIYWFLINKYWFWRTLLLCPVSVLFLPYLLYLRSWALFFSSEKQASLFWTCQQSSRLLLWYLSYRWHSCRRWSWKLLSFGNWRLIRGWLASGNVASSQCGEARGKTISKEKRI